jgi:hypothetical protein
MFLDYHSIGRGASGAIESGPGVLELGYPAHQQDEGSDERPDEGRDQD